RDGAQAGADRLPGVAARPDVRAPEPGGVRGPDEGEATQGVAAEGAPAGTGRRREGGGGRSGGSPRGGAGGKGGEGGQEGEGGGEGEEGEPVRQVWSPGRAPCAPRRTRANDHLAALGKPAVGGSLQPTRATYLALGTPEQRPTPLS